MSYFDITGLNFKAGDFPMLTLDLPDETCWTAFRNRRLLVSDR
jgi:hypothetical protein